MARGRTPRRGELAVKITVFGGSGFLGSHICDKLSEAGHAVTIVDLHPSPWLRPDQTMLTGNILDEETVRRGVEGADMVFNYAGIADIGEANNRPVDTARINVLGNVMILEACRRERVRRYVFASSLYVYGKSGGFYRCSKQACEIYIENYQAMHKLPYTILRYGSLYGPRADRRNAIHRFVYEALTTGAITYYGAPTALREYVHVDDASTATLAVLAPEFENQNIIISGNQPMRARGSVQDDRRNARQGADHQLSERSQQRPLPGHALCFHAQGGPQAGAAADSGPGAGHFAGHGR